MLRHVLRSNQFDLKTLNRLFMITDTIRQFNQSKEGLLYLQSLLPHKRVMLFFSQPSTRTFMSFESACHILGLKTSEIRNTSVSSEAKGESIEDSLRTFSSYVDLIIMRSAEAGLCERIACMLDETPRPVPLINAGSGPDEHPTQAILDLYTMYRCFRSKGGIDGKTVCMVGDVKRGRTVRSLACLLTHFNNVHIVFSSPKEFRIEDALRQFLKSKPNVSFTETENFIEPVKECDAVYMTRLQDEYSKNAEDPLNHVTLDRYHLKVEHLSQLKDDMIILHPMPRRQELDPRIDTDPRAQYWRQERNGMWIRAALITMILGVDEKILLPEIARN